MKTTKLGPMFAGELPMVWVPATDVDWPWLCSMWAAAHQKRRPFAMLSKHAPGEPPGWFFPVDLVESVRAQRGERPALLAERPDLAAAAEERIRAGMQSLAGEMRAAIDAKKPPRWDANPETALRKRLRDLGHPESALDDVPERLT